MRLKQLDVLRGVAILLVLGHHTPRVPAEFAWPLRELLGALRRCGWAGVDLFFVLSGFLVSGLLFREYQRHGEIRFARFFTRRGFKIYPAFYTYLFGSTLVKLATGHPVPLDALVSETLFVQNYGPALQGHTWSLAIEEHFYLMLPLLLIALARRGGDGRDCFRPLLAIFAAVTGVALALRFQAALAHPYAQQTHLFPTHLRIDSLFFGVVLSYLFHFHRGRCLAAVNAHGRLLLLASAVLVSPILFLGLGKQLFLQTVGFTFVYLGFGGFLMVSVCRPPSGGRVSSIVAFVGFYSYSIYLWNKNVLSLGTSGVNRLLGPAAPYPVESAVYVLGAIAVGIVMARVVEVPFLALRDRWFPSRSEAIGGRGELHHRARAS
jgi:peptidoglycan/LPS O-acetylase OafA/YrhL